MKYYMVSEQNLYELLVDLENCLYEHLERLEMYNEYDEYDEKMFDEDTPPPLLPFLANNKNDVDTIIF